MALGEYIKSLRIEKELSQRDLANRSGISNAEVSRLETGNRQKPSLKSLIAIGSSAVMIIQNGKWEGNHGYCASS